MPRCPTCNREFDAEQSPAMPFCSERCRLVDLGHWLGERYGVPHEGRDDEELDEGFDLGDDFEG